MKSGRTKKGKELLSFEDEETEEEPLPVKKPRLPPNPEVSPLNIPDYQKTLEESAIRTKLQVEYECLQEAIKVRKATTIGEFLATAREILVKNFPALKKVPSDLLMFVKGDMILPHFVSFYDLIIAEAKGSAGDILRLKRGKEGENIIDVDEAGVGKILERKWYEKNRHIYPASQWVLYDPASSL